MIRKQVPRLGFTSLIAGFMTLGITAAIGLGWVLSGATLATGRDSELDPEVLATLDTLSQQQAAVMKDCPQFGQQITDEYLMSIGLETPELPPGLVESATARSLHCGATSEGIVQIQIDITGPDEPREMWSSIFIGPAGEPDSGHGAEQILNYAESELIPQMQLLEEKPALIRHQIGANSLLAIDPRSELAAHADEPRSASIGQLTTRWAK